MEILRLNRIQALYILYEKILIKVETLPLLRGAGAGPTGTAAAGPMLEAKLMDLIKGLLQKFWLSMQ